MASGGPNARGTTLRDLPLPVGARGITRSSVETKALDRPSRRIECDPDQMSVLRIRGDQRGHVTRASGEALEDNVVGHLRRVWTEEAANLSDEDLCRWARYGVERGSLYGIESELEVALFVDLMFLFGPHFDTCDALPWARAILADPSLTGRQRVDALMSGATQYCADRADQDARRHRGLA